MVRTDVRVFTATNSGLTGQVHQLAVDAELETQEVDPVAGDAPQRFPLAEAGPGTGNDQSLPLRIHRLLEIEHLLRGHHLDAIPATPAGLSARDSSRGECRGSCPTPSATRWPRSWTRPACAQGARPTSWGTSSRRSRETSIAVAGGEPRGRVGPEQRA